MVQQSAGPGSGPSAILNKGKPVRAGEGITVRITIDGPSASGKSAVGSRVAARLGLPFVDTGVMYRALTWLALDGGVPLDDDDALTALAEATTIRIGAAPADGRETCSVLLDGRDVTARLREAAVERNVSRVSAVGGVRRVMVRLQREAAPAAVVMAGRDIGTVVLPDAELKLWFAASVETRARRRQAELALKGRQETLAQVLADLERRDALDSSRDISPLARAEDALTVDTDGLTLDAVVARVLAIVAERRAALCRGGVA